MNDCNRSFAKPEHNIQVDVLKPGSRGRQFTSGSGVKEGTGLQQTSWRASPQSSEDLLLDQPLPEHWAFNKLWFTAGRLNYQRGHTSLFC